MVPAMDMFMKSSPASSQTSESEEGEKIDVGEDKGVTERNIQKRTNRNSTGW